MAAPNFPQIRPTTRRFKMGDIPSTTYTSLSGAVFRRAYGNKKTGYTLDLTFENISDTREFRFESGTTNDILNHYEEVNGTFETFAIYNTTFVGIGEDVKNRIKSPSNVKWRYAKPPEVKSVQSDISTVTVSLVGEIQA
jgi:hypothetical protein